MSVRPSRIPSTSARLASLAVLLCGLPLAATAHEGHDHEAEAAEAKAAAASAGLPSRNVAELTSELYEALVESHGDHLDIWLDRYDSNEPVTGAKLGVSVGDAAEVAAKEESPGQYAVAIQPIPAGTSAAVTLTVQAAAGEDLLGGTLEIAAEAHEDLASQLGHWLGDSWRWLLGLVVLGALVWFALRRRGVDGASGGRSTTTASALAPFAAVALLTTLAAAGGSPVSAHEGHDHAEEAPPAAAAVRALLRAAGLGHVQSRGSSCRARPWAPGLKPATT